MRTIRAISILWASLNLRLAHPINRKLPNSTVSDVDHADISIRLFHWTSIHRGSGGASLRASLPLAIISESDDWSGPQLHAAFFKGDSVELGSTTVHAHTARTEVTAGTSCIASIVFGSVLQRQRLGSIGFPTPSDFASASWRQPRPQIAQHRESQRPLQEPSVTRDFFFQTTARLSICLVQFWRSIRTDSGCTS